MYRTILKKDLKRKKTTNCILFLFISLATTFVASSVGNLISITTALDTYFDLAGLSDYFVVVKQDPENDARLSQFLDSKPYVDDWRQDEILYFTSDLISRQDQESYIMESIGVFSSDVTGQQRFFDSENREISSIEDGAIYFPQKLLQENGLQAGDQVTFSYEDLQMDFVIQGSCKDALLGSTMMGAVRCLISENDYEKIKAETQLQRGWIYSAMTPQMEKLESEFNQESFTSIAVCGKNLVAMTYVMDMIVAGILLVVSICLILISFVILRFTILFTLEEEFQQIGILKAIGISAKRIRGLYLVKYFCIATAGAAVGFFASIPFGNLFLNQISQNMVFTGGEGRLLLHVICALLVIGVVLLFCYFCTRRIHRFSPIDAIRNGSSGERFRPKGLFKLHKSRLPMLPVLALNDIVSGIRKYAILTLIFTLGVLLIIVPVNTANTLNSSGLITWFGMVESDLYLSNRNEAAKYYTADGKEALLDALAETEQALRQKGVEAKLIQEMLFRVSVTYENHTKQSMAFQGVGTTAGQYTYLEGKPPEYENELAITHLLADKIGAKIGDTVQIKLANQTNDYLITAFFQSMNNMGDELRFSEKAKLDYSQAVDSSGLQVIYQGNPSEEQKQQYHEIVQHEFPDYELSNSTEYLNKMIGNIGGQINAVKQMIVLVVLAINVLVTVLMVRTFLAKEKGEISMLKSIGFRNAFLIRWQSMRIGLVLLFAVLLGAVLSNPVAQISSAKVFEMMGASSVAFVIRPFEVYFFYPVLLLSVTVAASVLAAQHIRKISTQETNTLE